MLFRSMCTTSGVRHDDSLCTASCVPSGSDLCCPVCRKHLCGTDMCCTGSNQHELTFSNVALNLRGEARHWLPPCLLRGDCFSDSAESLRCFASLASAARSILRNAETPGKTVFPGLIVCIQWRSLSPMPGRPDSQPAAAQDFSFLNQVGGTAENDRQSVEPPQVVEVAGAPAVPSVAVRNLQIGRAHV